MEKIQSKDGTTIAFDQWGGGRAMIVVGGAACDRGVNAPIAQALAQRFTVLNFDRRGRGDSDDTLPYAVAREVEDIAGLIDAAGGSASLLGLSSGAALAAEAAASGLPIDRLIMWEPPFATDSQQVRQAQQYADRLAQLLAAGRRDDALAHFMRHVGLPEPAIAGARQSPYWQVGVGLAPMLAYDAAILGDGTYPRARPAAGGRAQIPTGRYSSIGVPTLVLSGSQSPELLRRAAVVAAQAIPGARHEVLAGQDHSVAGEVLAPVVASFVAGR